MRTLRHLIKALAGVSAGGFLPRMEAQQARPQAKHSPVMVAGRRVKTVDVHCHVNVPEVIEFLKERRWKAGPLRPRLVVGSFKGRVISESMFL